MAIMHPSDISKRKHVKSEEDFFIACKNQLSEKFHVFFSVRWYSEENGKRVDSECDFLVFNPDYGFLCLECKGGKGIYVDEEDTWFLEEYDEDRKLRCSPYKQAEESMWFFKKYYEEELETAYPGIYGNAVVFPKFAVSSPITVDSPLILTIDMNDMENLQTRIIEIFRYFNVKCGGVASFMAPDAQNKFISLINKRVALSVAAGALIDDKMRELTEINQMQDVVIDLLTHYPKAFIIGGAGTGKTWIGIKKIKRCLLSEQRPLYLCYNPILAARVKESIGIDGADVFSIDAFAEYLLGEIYQKAPVINGFREYANLLSQLSDIQRYDLVIVDEAQDFSEDWALCANLVLKDHGSLYVFYDECQNVFARHFGDKFCIENSPFVLRYNIRNTSNIYQYTIDRTSFGTDTLVNQIEGVEPDVRKLTHKRVVISFIDSVVNKLVNKEGVSPDKIVILSNLKYEQSALCDVMRVGGYPLSSMTDSLNDSIVFATVEDYKGLEADIIIYINHTFKGAPATNDSRAIQYTAFTRARFYLYVIDYEKTL